eukprot:snap_masked-scaffold_3-processed-gene-11.9-mRNA-1 protein AED:1.00 eAED:1.00 QI:0/-1/0/0/-1/1/1/0/624
MSKINEYHKQEKAKLLTPGRILFYALIILASLIIFYQLKAIQNFNASESVSMPENHVGNKCIIINREVYSRTIFEGGKQIEKNMEISEAFGCEFFQIIVKADSCSHWKNGLLHDSFCIIQDLLNLALQYYQLGPFKVIMFSTSGLISENIIKKSFAELDYLDEEVFILSEQSKFVALNLEEENVQRLSRDLCNLWKDFWKGDIKNISQEITLFTYVFKNTPVRKINFPEEIMTKTSSQKSTLGKYLQQINLENPELMSHSLSKEDFSKYNRVQIKLHYARDKCVSINTRYNYPEIITPEAHCLKHRVPRKKKSAIAFYFTSFGSAEKFETIKRYSFDQVLKLSERLQDTTIDLVLLTSKIEHYDNSKRKFIQELKTKVTSSAFKHIAITDPEHTIREKDFDPSFLDVIVKNWNCCSWLEYQKLSAWTLTQYQSVLLADFDVEFDKQFVKKDLQTLLDCTNDMNGFEFISTTDPRAALQGGFYLLKPSIETFNEMKSTLGRRNVYNPYSGFLESGPTFAMAFADPKRRRLGKDTQSYANETPQGFLFYFFHIYQKEKKTAQFQVCEFNWRIKLQERFSEGLLDFLCPFTLQKILLTGNEQPLKVCHKCSTDKTFKRQRFGVTKAH